MEDAVCQWCCPAQHCGQSGGGGVAVIKLGILFKSGHSEPLYNQSLFLYIWIWTILLSVCGYLHFIFLKEINPFHFSLQLMRKIISFDGKYFATACSQSQLSGDVNWEKVWSEFSSFSDDINFRTLHTSWNVMTIFLMCIACVYPSFISSYTLLRSDEVYWHFPLIITKRKTDRNLSS